MFEQGKEYVSAVGGYTHVFVERGKKIPGLDGMPSQVRSGLQKLLQVDKPKL